MKKLMIVAFAVAFAAVAQAASINWGGAVSMPDGETEIAAGTMAYLVWSDAAFTGTGVTFDGSNLAVGETTLATTVDSHAITADEAANWDFGSTYATAGDVNGFYAVLVSDGADKPMYSFYDLGEVTGTTAQSTALSLQVSWADGYTTQNGFTISGPESVPEPTSGLLLLLGMAGLALKRKQA